MRALVLDAILYEGTHFPSGEVVDLPTHVYDLHRAAGRVTTPVEAELVEAARTEADAFVREAANSGEEAADAARAEEEVDLRAVLAGHLTDAKRPRLVEIIEGAGLKVPRGGVDALRDFIMQTAIEHDSLAGAIRLFDPPKSAEPSESAEPSRRRPPLRADP